MKIEVAQDKGPSDFRRRRDYPTLAQVAQLWLAGFAMGKSPMSVRDLMRDLADKVLDGTFETTDPKTGDAARVETFTLMGSQLSSREAAFNYEAGVRAEDKIDRDAALAALAHKIRVAPDGLLRWQRTSEFSEWARLRGLPTLSFDRQGEDKRPSPVLTKAHAKKGGLRTKYNLGLQDAINRIADDIVHSKNPAIDVGTLKDWIREQTERNRDPEIVDGLGKMSGIRRTPYTFDPPIPDCDEIYIDGKKLVWRDREGRERHCSLRSLDPYVRRARARSQS